MEEPLLIRYIPEKDDYLQASRALAYKSTAFKVLAAVILVAMLAALVVLIFPGIGNPTWESIALILVVVGAFYIVYYFVIIPFQFSRAFKKNEYLRQERTTPSLTRISVCALGKTRQKWTGRTSKRPCAARIFTC